MLPVQVLLYKRSDRSILSHIKPVILSAKQEYIFFQQIS